VGNKVLPIHKQNYYNELTDRQLSFDSKVDNFLEIDKLKSLIVAPLLDEEVIFSPKIVGTLQLYNKVGGDINQEDLARVQYIRKLIGSMLIKIEHITNTLQMVVGFA